MKPTACSSIRRAARSSTRPRSRGRCASGEIGAAGLDVYETEPDVPAELLEAPNCVLLPHIGSATTRARNAMAELVADNVLAALAGGEPPNRVA